MMLIDKVHHFDSLLRHALEGNTGSFKVFCLDPHTFYLVILKYHMKPLGTTKTQCFRQGLYGISCFYTCRDYVDTSAVSHKA